MQIEFQERVWTFGNDDIRRFVGSVFSRNSCCKTWLDEVGTTVLDDTPLKDCPILQDGLSLRKRVSQALADQFGITMGGYKIRYPIELCLQNLKSEATFVDLVDALDALKIAA